MNRTQTNLFLGATDKQGDAFAHYFLRWSERYALSVLRIGFGVLFLWLGLLKVFPGVSPAEPLMQASMPSPDIALFIRFSSVWEILVGLGFITGRVPRITLLMTFATMLATLSIPWLAPQLVWRAFPFQLTFDGEYVAKDIVIVSSAIVLAAALRSRHALSAEHRVIRRAQRLYDRFEAPALHWAARHSQQLLRIAYSVVFFWFGALKLVPGLDPSEPLVRSVVPVEPFSIVYAGVGLVEMFIAIGLMTRRLRGIAAVLSLIFLASTIVVLFVHADVMFSRFPVVLTLVGQHVLKNLVFLGAALVLLVGVSGRQSSATTIADRWVTPPVGDGAPAVRVLIVDDQPAFRHAARNVVAVLVGFEVAAEVATGEASVETANALQPDLVLMDVHLPDIDGIEASRRIVASAGDRAPVIFLLSTDEATEYTQRVTDCGATAYLPKAQFGPAALRAAWATATASRRAF